VRRFEKEFLQILTGSKGIAGKTPTVGKNVNPVRVILYVRIDLSERGGTDPSPYLHELEQYCRRGKRILAQQNGFPARFSPKC
jgi:hypothetical protein